MLYYELLLLQNTIKEGTKIKKNLGFCIGLVLCLTLASVLTQVPIVLALDTWRGTTSFSIKTTSINDDDPQNIKFANLTIPMTGTVELYTEKEDLVSNEEGCYIKFLNEDGTAFGFKNIAAISTEVKKEEKRSTPFSRDRRFYY